MERLYCVYIMSSLSRCLYTGFTNALVARVRQHRDGTFPGAFSRRYNTRRLVYFEVTTDVRAAIAREKQIKGWRRAKKIALIESFNPDWKDLAANWPEIEIPEVPPTKRP